MTAPDDGLRAALDKRTAALSGLLDGLLDMLAGLKLTSTEKAALQEVRAELRERQREWAREDAALLAATPAAESGLDVLIEDTFGPDEKQAIESPRDYERRMIQKGGARVLTTRAALAAIPAAEPHRLDCGCACHTRMGVPCRDCATPAAEPGLYEGGESLFCRICQQPNMPRSGHVPGCPYGGPWDVLGDGDGHTYYRLAGPDGPDALATPAAEPRLPSAKALKMALLDVWALIPPDRTHLIREATRWVLSRVSASEEERVEPTDRA